MFVCTFQLSSREDTCYLSLVGPDEFNDGFFRGRVPFQRDACHSGASDHPVDATTDASTSCHDAQPGVATHRGHNPRIQIFSSLQNLAGDLVICLWE